MMLLLTIGTSKHLLLLLLIINRMRWWHLMIKLMWCCIIQVAACWPSAIVKSCTHSMSIKQLSIIRKKLMMLSTEERSLCCFRTTLVTQLLLMKLMICLSNLLVTLMMLVFFTNFLKFLYLFVASLALVFSIFSGMRRSPLANNTSKLSCCCLSWLYRCTIVR